LKKIEYLKRQEDNLKVRRYVFVVLSFAFILFAAEPGSRFTEASYLVTKSGKTAVFIQGFDGHQFRVNPKSEIPISNNDRLRGWSWDGKTASYAATKAGKTVIYIQGFDGVRFGGNPREIPIFNSDRLRGWSWDGKTASYAAIKDGKTVIYVQSFDGVRFGGNPREIPISNSDRIRGWSWDGKTASYAATKAGKTVIYIQGFDGVRFGGNPREIPIPNADPIRGWSWGMSQAVGAAIAGKDPAKSHSLRKEGAGQMSGKSNESAPQQPQGKLKTPAAKEISYRNFTDDVKINPYPFDNGIRKNADIPFENGMVMFYRFMEGTKGEYVSEGSNGNILRWGLTNKDDQVWLIYPDESSKDSNIKKYRIQNKASQQYMAVTGNGNVHRWTKVTSDDSQLFEFKRVRKGAFYIQESTKNERIAVGFDGNILRWEANSGKEQQFVPMPHLSPTLGLHPQKMKIMAGKKAYMPGKIPTPPRIKDFSRPQNGPYYFVSESVLPGTHVNDPLYDNKIAQISKGNSPYYFLVREQYYKPVQRIIQANSKVTKVEEDALSLTEEQIKSVTETLGWALEASASATAGVGVPGAGASATAGLSAGLNQTTETKDETRYTTQTSQRDKLSINFTSPPQRLNVVVWYLMDRFTLYNYSGKPVPGKQWEVQNNKFVETYPYTPWDGASTGTR
jgi:hypothetical protein